MTTCIVSMSCLVHHTAITITRYRLILPVNLNALCSCGVWLLCDFKLVLHADRMRPLSLFVVFYVYWIKSQRFWWVQRASCYRHDQLQAMLVAIAFCGYLPL